MRKSLLPPNASQVERNFAETGAAIDDIAIKLRDIWNPDTCPVDFLPFLAWAFSVDRWDSAWPEATKRAVIKASRYIHEKKGTIAALRRVVEPLGYLLRVVEWFETMPEGERGTFAIDIGVLDTGITESMFLELERLIDDAKPVSRHLTGLAITLETRGNVFIGASTLHGDELTIYPYTPDEIVLTASYYFGAAEHTIDTLTINPM